MRAPFLPLALLCLSFCAIPSSARATTVLALDLAELESRADRIFVGTVELVTSGRDDAGLPVTWTTFRVDEALKGVSGAHVTVKQLRSGSGAGGIARVPGLPAYAVGEKLLLFLHADSARGFTSPVGLSQGCFRIDDGSAEPLAINDAGNVNLAPSASRTRAEEARAPIRLGTLLERVKALGAVRAR
jgi:hypothetical protein